MQLQHLSQDALGETIERARDIAEQSRELAAPESEYEAYLRAGEEIGIPREAMLQALRERLLIPGENFRVGQTVFAPSMDGFWYPAEITTLSDHTATVRFISGGEHTCALPDLRPLAMLPGRKLEADLKGWGWWSAIVDKYDPEKGKVRIIHDDWTGTKETLPLHRLRLSEKIARPEAKAAAKLPDQVRSLVFRCTLAAGTAGLLAGMLLDRLLPFLPFFR